MSTLIRATIQTSRAHLDELGGYAYARGRVVEVLKAEATANQHVLDEESVLLEEEKALAVPREQIEAAKQTDQPPIPELVAPSEVERGDYVVVGVVLRYSATAWTLEEATTRLLPEGWEHDAPRPTLPPSDSRPSQQARPSEPPVPDPVPAPTSPTSDTTRSPGSTRTSRTTTSSGGDRPDQPRRRRLRNERHEIPLPKSD